MIRWFQRKRPDRPAGCREVIELLQAYLDGEVDELAARRIADHLEDCRRCGLETATYIEIKHSLARRATVPVSVVERLWAFSEELLAHDHNGEPSRRDSRQASP